MGYRSFSAACIGLIVVILGGIGAFNFVVDPFWYFRVVERPGFNLDKPRAPDNEQWVKPALAARLHPEVVIVGNSFSEIGLPPTHPGLTDGGRASSFNLSLHGATADDIYCLARFAITDLHVRKLVVSVYGVDEAGCPSDAEFAYVDYGRLLFSRQALDASRKTMREQGGQPTMTREGLWTMVRYDADMQSDAAIATNFARQMKAGLCEPSRVDTLSAPRIDKSPVGADQGAGLRQIIRLARQHDVELVLILNPTHVLFNEISRRCGGASSHWQYLWQVASIVDQENRGDGRRAQLWDFYDYGPLTGERMHAGVPMRERLWQDGGHFNPAVGARVFDAIYGPKGDFGAPITPANFDQNLARVEAQRAAFLATNDWVATEIREIYERARSLRDIPPTPRLAPAQNRIR